ncbi:hypothetical protein RRG08_001031 [Elysia crispata]|uniref:Uncharacterized protein n=1 Tax=Elysia crispata TaxID=231223 RepID=A0AAE1AVX6_9GAST|nr:hypothetical protein RRG08_001031 [Elysia crispata]
MAHVARTRQLQDEFEAATGVRPKYPRSRVVLQGLRETLDRYEAAKANLKANDARRQGAQNLADEFSRLNKIEADGFDLDTPTSAGQLEGEAGRLLRRAKAQHRREGAAQAFSSWRQETPDPYGLGDVAVDDNISIRGGNIVRDYTLTAERATEVLKKLSDGGFLIKVKFLREQAPDVWVYEDGFAPLKQGRTRGGATSLRLPQKHSPALWRGLTDCTTLTPTRSVLLSTASTPSVSPTRRTSIRCEMGTLTVSPSESSSTLKGHRGARVLPLQGARRSPSGRLECMTLVPPSRTLPSLRKSLSGRSSSGTLLEPTFTTQGSTSIAGGKQ